MKTAQILLLTMAFAIFSAPASRADSIMDALKNIGEEANMANESFLDALNGSSPDAQLGAYRLLEKKRVEEMSAATGVDPDVIRKMRAEGATWEQIADKYNVNLGSLPSPQNVTP